MKRGSSTRLGRITPAGKAVFEWSVAFSALSLVFPIAVIGGVGLALDSRRRGYHRWLPALLVALWCGFLGVILRGMLHMGMVP